jgi:hypothetical protein
MTVARTSRLSRERPFPGLRPFAQEDHKYFFGREDQTFSLYRLIDRCRFVAVVGSSGSGKSSLVRAGLLPLVKQESEGKGGRTWLRTEMRPGNAPLKNLAAALTALTEDDPLDGLSAETRKIVATANRERVAYQLRYSTLANAIAEVAQVGKRSILLVVDQFEELFRYAGALASQKRELVDEARSRDEATLFVQLLLEASRSRDLDVTVLLTMRSDFIGECARFHDLPEAVSGSQYLVPSLTRDQLEEVICHPVKKAGATIDRVLVERLLNDAGNDPDQLPVLQHCLLRIWEQAGRSAGDAAESQASEPAKDPSSAPPAGRHLAIAQYDAIGRMNGAMSKHADEILARLPGLPREIELTFRALSELDREGRAIRRAIKFAALRAETGADESKLRDVIDRFREDDCSFLTPAKSAVERVEDGTTIDVGHEALLRRWEKLTGEPGATGDHGDKREIGWLRKEARDGRRYQALLSIADSSSDSEPVLHPDQTPEYSNWWDERKPTQGWAKLYGGDFELVRALILRSRAEAERTRALRRNSIVRKRWAAAAVAAALLVALWVGFAARTMYLTAIAQSSASIKSSVAILNQVHASFDRGDITLRGARDLLRAAAKAVDALTGGQQSPETKALQVQFMLEQLDIEYSLGEMDQARKLGTDAEAAAQQLVISERDNSDWQNLLYQSTFRVGDLAANWMDALKEYQSARAIVAGLAAKSPESAGLQAEVLTMENKIGEALQWGGQWAQSVDHFNSALAIGMALVKKEPDNSQWQIMLAVTHTKLGVVLSQKTQPDYKEALLNLKAGLSIQMELAQNPSKNTDVVQSNMATSYRVIGDVLSAEGNYEGPEGAFAAYETAIMIRSALFEKDTSSAVWMQYLVSDHAHYGDALKTDKRFPEALAQYNLELTIRQKLSSKDPSNTSWQKNVKETQDKIAHLKASLEAATNGASR